MKAPVLCVTMLLMAANGFAQNPPANYDESKVPPYILPDPLVLNNGQPVRDAASWRNRRRPEILELFRTHVYGRSPNASKEVSFRTASTDPAALGGKAVRKIVEISFANRPDAPRMNLLLYLPAGKSKVPVFVGLNFTGNATVHPDPGIPLGETWRNNKRVPTPESARGSAASRWPVERILERGYGLATAYYFDIEPDFAGGIQFGVRPLFFKPGQTQPEPDEWGAIGAWAWALSRALDYLETEPAVDARRVIVHGHSRLGKTALWAGAQDERFAMVISNDSGEGGAALSRRLFGETIRDLNSRFPHWFCGNYKKYNDRADALPVDQHMLLALIAPRPLYVASATEDLWADPRGEFLSLVAAGPVYRLLGKRDLGTEQMPPPNTPIHTDVGYHLRTGPHDITAYDWEQYLSFADRHLR